VSEGLSATDVGKEIGDHAKHAALGGPGGHDGSAHDGGSPDHARRHRLISIAEAVLLSIVTLTAAWSGYSAAKWNGKSAIDLAAATSLRTQASRNAEGAITVAAQDTVNFAIWFNAYLAGNVYGQAIAEKRFRPGYDLAFRAWLATDPFSNPNAPKGPPYMRQYSVPGQVAAKRLDAEADERFAEGQRAGKHAEDYVRVTVILASVLFIVGISSHFSTSAVRIGLVAVGAALLLAGALAILQLPGPPS
jgi:hypothetical protein